MRLSIALLAAPCFLYALPALATEPQPPGSRPPPGYGQQQSPPSYYGQPPPGGGYYGPPPGYYQPPPQGAYGPPPAGYAAPPAPPAPAAPPKGPQWSVRWNPLDLLYGRISTGVEYAAAGPLTVGLTPGYVMSKPLFITGDYDVKGWAIGGELGVWVEGDPFRGMALKLLLEHENQAWRITTADGSEVSKTFGLNKLGGMLAWQSRHGKWFTTGSGIGVTKDLSWSEDSHLITCPGKPAGTQGCTAADGLGRGWELRAEFSLGVIF